MSVVSMASPPLSGSESSSKSPVLDSLLDTAAVPARLTIMNLPPEIHVQITRQLIYPDALSLKHTCRYFYTFVDTGVKLKVEWFLSRRRLHLDCPNDTRCDLGSDLRFCRGSVPLLMQRRREHVECESRPGLGCLVYGTTTCTHRRRPTIFQSWFRRRLTIEMWWVMLALVPLVLSSMWFVELLKSVFA